MKRLAINVSAMDRAFEEAPEVSQTVRRDMALGVVNRVVNDFMIVIFIHADVGAKRIGVKVRAFQNMFARCPELHGCERS